MTKNDKLIAELAQLGGEHEQLTKQLEAVRTLLRPLIIKADQAGIPQVDIVDLTGYTRETVRKICLPPGQAEAEQEKRRARRRKQ